METEELDAITLKWITDLRAKLHGIDLSASDGVSQYHDLLVEFVTREEGARLFVYDDATGKQIKPSQSLNDSSVIGFRTVGVGFNMSDRVAKSEWCEALRNTGLTEEQLIEKFSNVFNGEESITNNECNMLLLHGLKQREDFLIKTTYKCDMWNKLKGNERVATVSLQFNGRMSASTHTSTLVGTGTKFYTHMVNYINTECDDHLMKVVDEVRNRSASQNMLGLVRRRCAEATLLESYLV